MYYNKDNYSSYTNLIFDNLWLWIPDNEEDLAHKGLLCHGGGGGGLIS